MQDPITPVGLGSVPSPLWAGPRPEAKKAQTSSAVDTLEIQGKPPKRFEVPPIPEIPQLDGVEAPEVEAKFMVRQEDFKKLLDALGAEGLPKYRTNYFYNDPKHDHVGGPLHGNTKVILRGRLKQQTEDDATVKLRLALPDAGTTPQQLVDKVLAAVPEEERANVGFEWDMRSDGKLYLSASFKRDVLDGMVDEISYTDRKVTSLFNEPQQQLLAAFGVPAERVDAMVPSAGFFANKYKVRHPVIGKVDMEIWHLAKGNLVEISFGTLAAELSDRVEVLIQWLNDHGIQPHPAVGLKTELIEKMQGPSGEF